MKRISYWGGWGCTGFLVAFLAASTAGASQPDLVVAGVDWSPKRPMPGDTVIFRARIRNTGTAAVPAGQRIGLQFQIDGANTTAWVSTWGGLPQNGTIELVAQESPRLREGIRRVSAWVDDNQIIPEVNESNNRFQFNLEVARQNCGITSQIPKAACIRDSYISYEHTKDEAGNPLMFYEMIGFWSAREAEFRRILDRDMADIRKNLGVSGVRLLLHPNGNSYQNPNAQPNGPGLDFPAPSSADLIALQAILLHILKHDLRLFIVFIYPENYFYPWGLGSLEPSSVDSLRGGVRLNNVAQYWSSVVNAVLLTPLHPGVDHERILERTDYVNVFGDFSLEAPAMTPSNFQAHTNWVRHGFPIFWDSFPEITNNKRLFETTSRHAVVFDEFQPSTWSSASWLTQDIQTIHQWFGGTRFFPETFSTTTYVFRPLGNFTYSSLYGWYYNYFYQVLAQGRSTLAQLAPGSRLLIEEHGTNTYAFSNGRTFDDGHGGEIALHSLMNVVRLMDPKIGVGLWEYRDSSGDPWGYGVRTWAGTPKPGAWTLPFFFSH
jgi:hypothetical protein